MSKHSSNFIPDQYPESQTGVSQKFDLDEYVREAKALKSEFVHDLEHQRENQPSDALKSEEGAGELSPEAMQEAKDRAEKIQEEAREQGYREGHEKGYKAGAEAAQEHLTSSMNALQSLVDDLSEIKEKVYPLMEREMVEIITTLARKVIHTELKGKENSIREIVRMAIESVLDRESLIIKVHPDDHRELQGYGQELIQLFHDIKNVSFESHPSVPLGNCVVESNFGTVEAGLDHLDKHIERILHLAPPPPLANRPDETDKPEEPVQLVDMVGPEDEDILIVDAEAYDEDLGIVLDEPYEPEDPDEEDEPESSS